MTARIDQKARFFNFLKWGLNIKKFNPARIPDPVPDFVRLLGVPKGIKPSRIIQAMRAKEIKVWTCSDLDYLDKIESDREPTKDYVIRLRDRQEADEELKNLSADNLKKKGIQGVTFTEQLLNDFYYWYQHKDHLDKQSITLCAGSRHPDGDVPGVYWDPYYGGVDVYWCYPDRAYAFLRSRQVVS